MEGRKTLVMENLNFQTSILSQAGWITGFAVFTALGAQVEIPNQPVPFTLQTFFVLLSGAFLGARNGFLSQVVYLALGTIGIPVFSGATFGLAKILGPTGGYLLGFPLAAMLVGYMVTIRKEYVWNLTSMFAGLLVIFTTGTLQLYAVLIHDVEQALISGFLIFSWWDILKLAAAAAIYTEFSKRFRRIG